TLGFISLRTALNADEVLAVAYEYTYGGQTYQVGEFSTDGINAPQTLILKLLKASNNAPGAKSEAGTWDLMMKNVYSLGASTMQAEKFELYIMYRNDSVGTSLQYINEGQIAGKQLIRVLGMDRLDGKNNPNPDGRFDFVEGYTAITGSGRIILPVVEPFGSYLRKQIGNDAIADRYVYQELYDSTLTVAEEFSEKNKFTIKGKYKGTAGNEIQLNAMNIPRGSVVVTAGGATLTENVDYTVDYMMGTVTILNQAIIESGTQVNVSLENQSTFSMQRKSLFGLHADYAFSKDLIVGATFMHLNEKPLTTKVNTGSEPLSNTIWGVNASWRTDLPWLTNALNKVPWITATQPSSLSVNGEFAQLIPGHTKTVTKSGQAYLDDFEATQTNIDIHYPNYWKLASTPFNASATALFPEAQKTNDTEYGKNRALFSWYSVDQVLVVPQRNTPSHLANDMDALSDHRVRVVLEQEIFPYKESLATTSSRLNVLNLSFYPLERGPYNLDVNGMNADGTLQNPEKRWGGMMRKIDNTDFETSNIEYIEFWMMDPFLTNADPAHKGGYLYFNLGDISEDILKDGKKAFESGIPVNGDKSDMETTVWGYVPKTSSTVYAFSNEAGARQNQDVGLNGMSTDEEFNFPTYQNYYNAVRAKVTDPNTIRQWTADPQSPFNDPAGDNYHFYRGADYDQEQRSILDRYKYYQGPEGNSPESSGTYGTAATLQPDVEDINTDNTLNEYEKYYQYRVAIKRDSMMVGINHITDKITSNVTLRNGQTVPVDWYQFKIPIRQYDERIGSIRNFKSIRFIRMFMTGFEEETHLRLATLDLVRGKWRNYTKPLYAAGTTPTTDGTLDVQAVNYEENSTKTPVNYVLPPGITRQTDPGQAQLIQQNEQAMVLRVNNLAPDDARAVYKTANFDMRNYKKMQLFVHAEQLLDEPTEDLTDYELTAFVRIGTDLQNNYYEYEIPLELTPAGIYSNERVTDRHAVWRPNNMFDFRFSVLTDAKKARNAARRSGTSGVSNTIPYIVFDTESGRPNNRITVMGNPTLGEVTYMMIGVRNRSTRPKSGEIWVNEFRMEGYNEDGGWAAMANASLAVSDIAQVNAALRYESEGYGGIESNILTRNMEDHFQFSFSAALEAGRLLPEKAKLQIPLYYAYTNNTLTPKYDPLDTDIKLRDALDELETKTERDSLKDMSQTVTTSHNFTVTNAKVNIKSKRPMFYDPANFSFSYSYSNQIEHDSETARDQDKTQSGAINYSFNFNPKPWEPFKKSKTLNKPAYKIIRDFNIYYLPQSWSFNTDMNRSFSQLQLRTFNADGTVSNSEPSFSTDWMWNRNFSVNYDLTRNIKFTLRGATNSTIDEAMYTPEIIRDYDLSRDYYDRWKDTVRHSLRNLGSPYSYQQVFTGSWNIPVNKIPIFDWITANASYNATYSWNYIANSDDSEDLGNQVSSLRTWQADAQFNFENLYNKSKYLKEVNQRFSGRTQRRQPFRPKTYKQTITLKAGEPLTINHRLNTQKFDFVAIDSTGQEIRLKRSNTTPNSISVTSPHDLSGIEVTFTTKDPNQRSAGQNVLDFSTRFLMMIRRVQVTYQESNSLAINGFYATPSFVGQQNRGGYIAPGLDYAFGFYGSDYLDKAQARGWLSYSDSVAQHATDVSTADFSIRATVEPFPGFKIELQGQRYIANSSNIEYMYAGMPETFTGSYNITQIAIGTAFKKIGNAASNYQSDTYDEFIRNLDIMQRRIQSRYDHGVTYGSTGFLEGTGYAKQQYVHNPNGTVDNGVSRTSGDVMIPAFLAAYMGRDANKMSTNPFYGIAKILPNWRITFDGLTRIPWVKKNFQSVSLTHGYTCKYTIGAYTSFSSWVAAGDGSDKTIGFTRDVQTDMPIPSSAYDISSVTLSEQFQPLIGLNITLKNSLMTKVEYRKQRNMSLNISSAQLIESSDNELVVGLGYTIKNFDAILKLKGGRQTKVSNNLKLTADVSYKNVKTLLRKIQEEVTQASNGNKVLSIRATADYVLSSKVNLQLYYERQATTPLISTSYPVTTSDFGVSLKFMLTR
ncbi:MAG: cell surface protein SprA, partial [Paludibacteraceae bacterium]|nr:cell surface protein SprA [Paludibacteraceae bacterium]